MSKPSIFSGPLGLWRKRGRLADEGKREEREKEKEKRKRTKEGVKEEEERE
jgi:hypothetical protein